MKKLTITIALTTLLSLSVFAHPVDVKTAQKVATTFLNNNGAKSTQLTDLSKAAGFANLYIFTAEQGFVVMAADDCVQPILGYSLTSTFVAEDMPENVAWWLRGYNEEIQYAIDNQMRATSETTRMWKELVEGNAKAGQATEAVAPLIQTKWNQNKYYNRLCPIASGGPDGHAYAGCVAIAMAQIMKYYNYPSTGVGSHSYTWNGQTLSADFGATIYDWNNMADYYEYYFINGTDQYAQWLDNPSEEEIAAVATLVYHCGVSVNMNYGGGGSGAVTAYAETALKNYFNYKSTTQYKTKSSYTDAQWMSMLKAELDASRPLLYSGHDPSGTGAGHAFVCDGYNSSNYFHFNWGWAGHYDGYFLLSNLDTGANNEAGSGNGVYTADQAAIFGIEPASNIPAPTNLTYTLSGLNDITLTWNGVSAASSYNVYCDGNLVGNTTSTTYSETAPFGTHEYFVRCVDANSQLSLPSNTVTVTIAYQTPVVTDLTATLSGNNANLSWTTPAWCYPETPLATLTYGDGNYSGSSLGFNNGSNMYWGHRYLSSNLTSYNNMIIYKAAFYANESGAYNVFVYEGTQSGRPKTKVLEQSLQIETTGWYEFDLSTHIVIDASKDYWIFMYDPAGRNYPATYTQYSGNEGNYYSTAITSWVSTYSNAAFLIKTYITDGTYTYNLYDGNTRVASNISNTTYTVNNITNNAAHRFTLKTNFNGGETDASNMVGFSLGNASLSSLAMAANDKMTITEGSKLTVSGTLSDVNVNNLILENGAQLVHNSANVQATVKKDIMPYTNGQNDGWSLVASPILGSITPSADNGWLSNEYDLYKFDQSEDFEWRNIEATSFATVDHKTGYLYANSDNTTLTIAGALAATTAATPLAYDASATWKGFNLIGNPYPCNAYINRSFYVLHEITEGGVTNTEFTLGSGAISPCAAILVQAQGANESVSFSKTPVNKSGIMATLTKAGTRTESVIDRARINFNSNDNLSKYTLSTNASKIYIAQGEQGFAVASAKGENEMSLNFEAAQNGTYTLRFDVENLELDYLHLIDNMTGNDIDLLTTPSYTFEAKTSDYASRFRLVFTSNDAIDDEETFAYIHHGEIIINNVEMCQGASIEVVDMTGRVIVSRDAMNRVSTSEMAAGVYVLRLINGDSIKTQKIVIE